MEKPADVEKEGAVPFETLQGPDGLNSIVKRFSRAVEVVRCAGDFYKRLAEIEDGYAASLQKLLRSSSYTFRQTFLQQLFGSGEAEEFGTLNNGWKLVGVVLDRLASHHSEKATNLRERVRAPLEQALPQLEKTKVELTQESKFLSRELAASEKVLLGEKKLYVKMSEDTEKLRKQKAKLEHDVFSKAAFAPKLDKVRVQLGESTASCFAQEKKYRDAVDEHCRKIKEFETRSASLARKLDSEESDRIELLKKSFQELARVLSDTCPTYLDGMQRILLFADEVNSHKDMNGFVNMHPRLKSPLERPKFESFQAMAKVVSTPREEGGVGKDDTVSVASVQPAKEKRDHAAEFFQSFDATRSSPVVKPKPPPRPPQVTTGKEFDGINVSNSDFTSVDLEVTNESEKRELKAPAAKPKPPPPVKSEKIAVPVEEEEEEEEKSEDDDNAENVSSSMPNAESVSADNVLDSIISFKRGEGSRSKPVISPKPKPAPKPNSAESKLAELIRTSKQNDFYGLLGATARSSNADLAKLRREKTARLHPDRFGKDERDERRRASAQLAELNRIYADVMMKEKARNLYNQLENFRKKYSEIATQPPDKLKLAVDRFEQLRGDLTRAHVPECLAQELALAVETAKAYEKQKTT